jgi:hypothetical protein
VQEIRILRKTKCFKYNKEIIVGRREMNVTWIGKYGRASKGAFEDADRCEHEARAYLDERHLRRTIGLQGILFDYLPSGEKK